MSLKITFASKCSGCGQPRWDWGPSRALFAWSAAVLPPLLRLLPQSIRKQRARCYLKKVLSFACATALVLISTIPSAHSQNPPPPPPQQPQYRVHVTSELVLVNVVVRDKKGNLV